MANVASVDVEINSTNVINDEVKPTNDEISLKTSESIIDQNDSRQTDPEGAQSPASSTYADCDDQNDISTNENHVECQNEETRNEIKQTQITLSKDDNIDSNENISLSKREENAFVNTETSDKCEINNNSKCDDDKSDPKLDRSDSIDSNEKPFDSEKPQNTTNPSASIPEDKFPQNCENEEEIYAEEDLADEHYDEEDDKSRSDGEYSEGDSDHEEDRENGDGEEGNEDENAAAQKPLDDDEDRRNPQYIPKRGFFYEHDDRTVNTSEDETSEGAKKEAEVKEVENAKGKGKRFIPDGRWQHDLYKEDEQKPKSSQELINIYGYDIRNEESAPKARRRRKYGRGPNKYTRKWDDEGAYAKQLPSKPFRPRNKTSFKKEDYDQEFPAIDERKSPSDVKIRERIPPKKSYHNEQLRNEDIAVREDHRPANPKPNPIHQDRPRNFAKRIPSVKEHRSAYNTDNYDPEYKSIQKTIRNSQFAPASENVVRGRGRGIGHGKNIRVVNNYEEGTRLQFTPGNRGRAKRLPKQTQNYYPSKLISDDNIQELSEQMAATDLASKKKTLSDKQQYTGELENAPSNEQPDGLLSSLNTVSNVRSKRYSHQRQRLLPEVNKNATATALSMHQSIQQNMQPITHSIQNVAASGLCQSMAPTHTSMPLMTQNQCSPTPQTVAAPLSVTPSSIPSSSLAVSASLIPLSAPPLTASGPALSAGAPPLPIMGFFQHPQAGYTNQAAQAQLYTRDQTVMGAASNQPVQLVAFLPASPILSNTNHTQSAPPPPPPPPPPGFPTTVMSYQQNTPSPQNAASFNSETYNMPPVTLAPIHQPPEMYQSRGGVTYYNTRSQVKPRSPPPPRVKTAIPIVPPPSSEAFK